ncbi:MAG: multiheme c-type cytochrome, partial [Plesiomonas sp.]
GHVNHQKFTKDFSVMNCTSCHVESPTNTNFSGPGCIDCHGTSTTKPGDIIENNGTDWREIHEKKVGLSTSKAVNDSYKVKGTPVTFDETKQQWCTTMSLYKVDGTTETLVDLKTLINDAQTTHDPVKPINYAGSYLHGVYNKSVVGRIASAYDYSYEADGSKTMCYTGVNLTNWNGAGLMASLRVSFTAPKFTGGDSNVTTIHGYTDVTDPTTLTVSKYDRRHNVTEQSCTTCHNSETNYHKNGNYANGGLGCIACHNNGQDRSAKNTAPGFGPMIHSWHWGKGSTVTNAGQSNSAKAIAPQTSCVACHDGVVDLNAIPNQYIKAKAFSNGAANKMASPITANCYACHTSDAALAHMTSQGGAIAADAPTAGNGGSEWYQLNAQESCAVCHAEGKSSGIEKHHKFTR